MEFEVETAGVTDWLTLGVPPPEGGGVGLAVGADHPCPPVPSLNTKTVRIVIRL